MAVSTIYLFNLFLLSCKRVSTTKGLLQKYPNVLPRISKLFARPQSDHGGIIHDQAYNFAFHQNLQSFQCNAFPAVLGTTRGTSGYELCQELSLESPQLMRWYRELCCSVNIYNSKYPDYFLISTNRSQETINFHSFPQFKAERNLLEN